MTADQPPSNPQVPQFLSPELLLSAIVDSSDDAIVSKNLNGIVTSWNRGAERIFGYTAEEMIGKPITILIPPERLEEEPNILRRLRNGERVDHFDTERVRKDGRRVDVSLTISPIRDGQGVLVGASKIARDITDKKLAEKALKAAEAEASRQSRMKDEFLATLSHELRTPLQSILGWTQILLSDTCDDAEMLQGLEVIDRNAQAQTRIIEDLLDMSSILSGKVRLDVRRMGLTTILQDILETVKPAAQAKEIHIQTILDAHALPVWGDPNRIQQILWNLLSNAIKFTPHGGKVQVLLERVYSHVEVTITDNGPGIDPEFLPYIFERFRQADATTTRKHGGLGLGLAIVKNLTELHGGNVRAKSGGLGTGASFTVALPIAAAEPEPERPTSRGSSKTDHGGSLAQLPRLVGVSVLVVDDEEDARNLVAKLLEKAGATVRKAGSAAEALSLFGLAAPDVLVSDIGMPVQDGYALIKMIRKLPPAEGGRVPAVALSAYSRMEDHIRAISEGFQMYLAKPANGLELVTMVKSLTGTPQEPEA